MSRLRPSTIVVSAILALAVAGIARTGAGTSGHPPAEEVVARSSTMSSFNQRGSDPARRLVIGTSGRRLVIGTSGRRVVTRTPMRGVLIGTPVRRLVIGTSVQGRPIVAWALGRNDAPRKILVVGCIHGNECAGLAITSALRRTRVPGGVQLWLVPEMNPDGTAADTRQNAHGVDLNRNFPYRWHPISDPTYYSGPHSVSEPETRAAMRLVRQIRPAVTIWYHQHMDLVDMAGGDRGVARLYAELAGLRPTCLTFLSGEETEWSNHAFRGTTSFVVELPAGTVDSVALARHLRAVGAMELGRRTGSPTRCDSVTTAA